jgi:hypothetical protein
MNINPGSAGTLSYLEASYNIVQQGPSKAFGPTQAVGISSNVGRICKKIEGKDMSNVRPLPMQETSSSGILTLGASRKPVEVMGLKLIRTKLPKALDTRPKKTGDHPHTP